MSANAAAASKHVHHEAFLAGQNPSIQYAGSAQFPANLFCTWTTKNGQASTLTINNPGANTLTVLISGAPASIVGFPGGGPLNGKWTISPNQPTATITAAGDFLGQVVTIFNVSNPSTTCAVNAVVAS